MGVYEYTNPEFEELFGDNPNLTDEEIVSKVTISPNRVAFVRKDVKLGIIPRILQEFLNTRIMIKRSTKYVIPDSMINLLVSKNGHHP
jgi:DNA polymerase zeta